MAWVSYRYFSRYFFDIPIVKAAQARGIDVVSEVELAYEVSKSPIVAVTGTNGKTTSRQPY